MHWKGCMVSNVLGKLLQLLVGNEWQCTFLGLKYRVLELLERFLTTSRLGSVIKECVLQNLPLRWQLSFSFTSGKLGLRSTSNLWFDNTDPLVLKFHFEADLSPAALDSDVRNAPGWSCELSENWSAPWIGEQHAEAKHHVYTSSWKVDHCGDGNIQWNDIISITKEVNCNDRQGCAEIGLSISYGNKEWPIWEHNLPFYKKALTACFTEQSNFLAESHNSTSAGKDKMLSHIKHVNNLHIDSIQWCHFI